MNAASEIFQNAVEQHRLTLSRIPALLPAIEEASELMITCLKQGSRLFFCGNGGSAADAQHLAAEFTGRFLFDRQPLDAQALHCNTSALTAVGNDYGFDEVFARQVRAHGRKGDVLIGISTSGNSRNVVCALEEAKKKNMHTIAMTGNESRAMGMAEIVLKAPSDKTPRIQEMHIMLGHILAEIVENALCQKTT